MKTFNDTQNTQAYIIIILKKKGAIIVQYDRGKLERGATIKKTSGREF